MNNSDIWEECMAATAKVKGALPRQLVRAVMWEARDPGMSVEQALVNAVGEVWRVADPKTRAFIAEMVKDWSEA